MARPVSAALVLTLLLSLWIYVQPIPRGVTAVITILILLPALRIMRLLVAPALVPYIYGLGAFFLADLIRNLASIVPLLEQQIFVLEMLAGVVLLAWWLARWRRSSPVPDMRVARILWVAGTFALTAFALALVAGVSGYMRIALVLGSGVLGSGYLAVVLYTGVRVADRLIAFALHEPPLTSLAMVRHNQPFLERRARRLLNVVATAAWVYFALRYFHVWPEAVAAAEAVLGASLTRGSLSISVGDLLVFALTVGAAFVLSRIIRFVLAEEVYPRVRLGRGLPDALSGALHYGLLLTGFLLALAALGVDLTKITILAGALGVGIGFGLQNIVNNFVSGLIVLFERPVRVGDAVQIGDVQGEVRRIGIRSTTVRSWEGAEVIVPNSQLVADRVTNWTPFDQRRRLEIRVNVAYGSAPDKVLQVLTEVAQGHPDVASTPAPLALFLGFGDSALQFQLFAWTSRLDRYGAIKSELGIAVYAAFREAGFSIPFPQQEIRISQAPPTAP
jgi:small-conductance mechanosensitive channel